MDLINKLFCKHKNIETHIEITKSQIEIFHSCGQKITPTNDFQSDKLAARKHITTVICKDCMMIKQKVINLD